MDKQDIAEQSYINGYDKGVRDLARLVKMAFYYEFDELIPSIMADKIDEIVKELTVTPKSENLGDDCVCCGKYAGEGRQVCVNCEVKNGL